MSAATQTQNSPDPATVILKAFNRACVELGVNKADAAKIIGVNRSTLARKAAVGFSHDSKSAELSLHFIRLYRSLYAIAGGDQGFMRQWFSSSNSALHGVPRELVMSVAGLIQTNDYLDAMRGKI